LSDFFDFVQVATNMQHHVPNLHLVFVCDSLARWDILAANSAKAQFTAFITLTKAHVESNLQLNINHVESNVQLNINHVESNVQLNIDQIIDILKARAVILMVKDLQWLYIPLTNEAEMHVVIDVSGSASYMWA
jgi:DNA-binding LytR/AlgR family response regulator